MMNRQTDQTKKHDWHFIRLVFVGVWNNLEQSHHSICTSSRWSSNSLQMSAGILRKLHFSHVHDFTASMFVSRGEHILRRIEACASFQLFAMSSQLFGLLRSDRCTLFKLCSYVLYTNGKSENYSVTTARKTWTEFEEAIEPTVLPELTLGEQLLLPNINIVQTYTENLQQPTQHDHYQSAEEEEDFASGLSEVAAEFVQENNTPKLRFISIISSERLADDELHPHITTQNERHETSSMSELAENENDDEPFKHPSERIGQSNVLKVTDYKKEVKLAEDRSLLRDANVSEQIDCNLNVSTTFTMLTVIGTASFRCTPECPEGTYSDERNKECIVCDSKCRTCVGPSFMNCTTCVSGAVQATVRTISVINLSAHFTLTCLSECASDHFNDNGVCRPCHDACLGCIGPQQDQCLQSSGGALVTKRSSENQSSPLMLCEMEPKWEKAVANLEIVLPLSFILFLIIATVLICIKWHVQFAHLSTPLVDAWKRCTVKHHEQDQSRNNDSPCKK